MPLIGAALGCFCFDTVVDNLIPTAVVRRLSSRKPAKIKSWQVYRRALYTVGREGRREGGRDGRMEGWKDGGMEGWRDGRMEGWKDGGMELSLIHI